MGSAAVHRRPRASLATGALLALALAVLAAAPFAAAHGAPSAKDQDTRLLADHNDDCGGDEAGSLGNCRGTHDLIALDVRERHDDGQDVVVFRFFLNGGTPADGLRDVLSLKADGASKTFEIRTSNNQDFQGTGFDSVGKAQSINDGTRFTVEATVKRSSLGAVGGKLTDFRLEAYRGTTTGDYLPGGYHGPIGNVADPAQSPATNRVASCLKPGTQQIEQAHCYRLRGPGYYVSVDDPGAQTVAPGSETIVQLHLRNALPNTAQALTVTLAGADGVRARFHDPNSASGVGYSDQLRIDLPKAGSTSTHIALDEGQAGSSGTLTVVVTTDLGGRSEAAIPYTVGEGPAQTTTSAGTADDGGDDKGAPAPPAILVLLALFGVAFGARRRT